MLYAMNKWKHMALFCLWPYTMCHTNDVTNATPRKGDDQSPLECFPGVKITPKLHHYHAFSCPTYVLDNALQSGQGSPKWKQCSRLGIYLMPSLSHARSVALVLNACTGHVSPQFHVKFDDWFETVHDKYTDMDAHEPDWKYLSGFAVKKGRPEPAGRGIAKDLIAPRRGPIMTTHQSSTTANLDTQVNRPEEPTILDAHGTTDNQQEDPSSEDQPAALLPGQQIAQAVPPARQTRIGRVVRNTPRYDQSVSQRNQGLVAWEVLLDQDDREDVPMAESQHATQKAMENPMAFAATTNPDILYWDQAMKAPDRDKFIEAV